MYLTHIPSLLKPLMKELVWNMPDDGQSLYLTFDDGPTPGVTERVLEELARWDAKATFFCLGRQASQHPELMERIRLEGHTIGHHTNDHLNGWRTPTFTYLRNVLLAQRVTSGRLFRPPYGRISRKQAKALRARFDVVMWDVLSGDFDTTLSGTQCAANVLNHARPGSIIVFHDSLKAGPRVIHALSLVLEHYVQKGYTFQALPASGPAHYADSAALIRERPSPSR